MNKMKPYTNYLVRLGDLKKAIQNNPYDPTKDIDGYMRYLKYNTSESPRTWDTGRWIVYPEAKRYDAGCSNNSVVCSNCAHCYNLSTPGIEDFDFCPHCGADMRGDPSRKTYHALMLIKRECQSDII